MRIKTLSYIDTKTLFIFIYLTLCLIIEIVNKKSNTLKNTSNSRVTLDAKHNKIITKYFRNEAKKYSHYYYKNLKI